MNALVFEGAKRASVVQIDRPAVHGDEVLIRSHTVGICHSDLELYEGRYIIPVSYPVIPGHEWCGEVAEVGPTAVGVDPRDHVVGECVVGPAGRDHFGFSISGALAEYFTCRAEWLHKVPPSMPCSVAALVEPFSVAYNATLAAGGVDACDVVGVLGAGPIGLLATIASAATNAQVAQVEVDAARRAKAMAVGAVAALDPGAAGFGASVAQITEGRGFDVVIEATGAPAAMAMALEIAGREARVVYLGIDVGTLVPAQLGLIQAKALRIRGVIGSVGLWPKVVRMVDRQSVHLQGLVTARYPLQQAQQALEAARDTTTNVKVQVEVGG